MTGHRPLRDKLCIIKGWPCKTDKLEHNVDHYWPIRHEVAMIDGIAIKIKRIFIPFLLQGQILE